ncbi:MAG: hypothetical protein IPK68_05165 [Bdellovibrionales bacterium]|nr:hypothetical protein [Bdellovibrionales bacterium]
MKECMKEYLTTSSPEPPLRSRHATQIDWCGKWFEVAKNRGENHIVSFGRGIPDPAHNGLVQKKNSTIFLTLRWTASRR